MKNLSKKYLRLAISKYTMPSNKLASLIFFLDISVYVLAIAGTMMFDNILLKVLCGTLAGLKIGTLFLISHDAAHGSFVSNRFWNKVIGRIAFLPSFHNYSLWLNAHNRLHHQSPNIKGLNSWSPMSKNEFDELPVWRKKVERLYRCPIGVAFNYMIERWWKNKFFPYKSIVEDRNINHWLDFILVSTYMLCFVSLLLIMGMKMSHTSPLEVMVFSLMLPFFVGNFLIGFTVYQHHTHESIPWFSSIKENSQYLGHEDLTVNVKYPGWYNVISNNAMIHTAHHVDPRIPLYNLFKAQTILYEMYGEKMISMDFSFTKILQTMDTCKLYDYNNHCWLDFDGRLTAYTAIYQQKIDFSYAA